MKRVMDIAWHEFERRLSLQESIGNLLEASIKMEKLDNILKQIIDVTIFLGERGLAVQGSSLSIGDTNNGNVFGLIVAFPMGTHSKGICTKGRRDAEEERKTASTLPLK